MNERRQRAARAGLAGLLTLGGLAILSGCDARTSGEGAQTVIAIAQTALPGVQTSLPGVQATAQAGATAVAGVLSDPKAISAQLQLLLAGSSIDLETTPAGVANDAVTQVTLTATDAHGTLAQLDARSRQAAATGALVVVSQYFPNASIALTVVDAGGAPLVSGSKAPGQTASVQ